MDSKIPGYILSEDDRNNLQLLWTEWQRRNQGASNRPYKEDEGHQAPEMYVVKTPTTGIDALSDTLSYTGTGTVDAHTIVQPGYADCDVFYLDDSVDPPELYQVGDNSMRIYNISSTAIGGSEWITAHRDKYGIWYASPPSVATEVTPCTITVITNICRETTPTGTSSYPVDVGTAAPPP